MPLGYLSGSRLGHVEGLLGNFVLNVELSVSDWAMLKAMLTLLAALGAILGPLGVVLGRLGAAKVRPGGSAKGIGAAKV